ncbi:YjbQ family protein [Lactobacillus sp. ESL0791]|uniref:YjbQ family protein n=1 Tax=Lactobacillus sp. ESL0791 TaxID=2983234 RepID=UPI0023F7E68A|nr:YjbQ family protein [Lactobacillus sp. ESL0791]MDF7639589.1 YjbQ family protein [Lactobacillus sp. ESL0791]
MKVYQDTIQVTTKARVTYVDITSKVRESVKKSDVDNGICLVQTPHTTCSVIFEEYVHDHDYNGDEYLQADLNNILDKLIPREYTENLNYRYPGPKHIEFLEELSKKDPNYPNEKNTILNGDAHIKGSLFGGNQTFAIKDQIILIGSVGYVYFVDWDQNRERQRKCNIVIVGE